ncbi:putative Pentatricopeptide repeat-containing protein [Zostera marina]|uniref:Putative Pentatricopeptide repeat-containing protein n=1 Tax=Zostera marina TaxID=29655 RepID=A0A0K9PJD0_ZOSMR|nr:putative Pentatricopeptide repeat-containing protein [Zostera marina]
MACFVSRLRRLTFFISASFLRHDSRHYCKNTDTSQKSLSSTLRSIDKENNPETLHLLLRHSQITTTPGLIRAAHPVLVSAFRRLVASGHGTSVSDFLNALKRSSPHIIRESFAFGIITLYGKAGMGNKASETFLDLPFLGCPRTAMSFRALLCALVDSDAVGSAFDLLEKVSVEHPKIIPGEVCYNVVIHGLLRKGDLEKVASVMGLMKERGLSPNVVTRNTLMNGYYRNRRFDLAEMVWREMGDAKKTMKTYNARLRGLVEEGRTAEAIMLFEEMDRNGDTDGYSFTAVIMAHCRDGKLEEAKKLFEEMRKKRCRPNWLTFEALVPKLVEAGEIDMGLMLCEECFARKLRLTGEVLQSVVNFLVENSRVEDANKLVQLGCSSGFYDHEIFVPNSDP